MRDRKHFKTTLILTYSLIFGFVCFTGAPVLGTSEKIAIILMWIVGGYLFTSTFAFATLILMLEAAKDINETIQYWIMVGLYFLFLQFFSDNGLWLLLTDWDQATPLQGLMHIAFLISAILSYWMQLRQRQVS